MTASGGWMWLVAQFEPADLLFRTTYSDSLPLQVARDAVLELLSALPGTDPFRRRVLAGPRPGEHDVTVTAAGPSGLVTLALVELGGRSPQEGADQWAREMATELRAQGVDAQVAVRPAT